MAVDPVEAFRLTVAELGEVPDLQLATAIQQKFGLKINPRYFGLYRAMLRSSEIQNQISQAGMACRSSLQPPQTA